MESRYIYGFIQVDEGIDLGAVGLGGAPVYAVSHQGLAGLVSNHSGPGFGALPKEELVSQLLAHQSVVERIMASHAVLPAKFGTILAGAAEVRELLSQGYSRLLNYLARVQGKVEVEVAATWDTGRVLAEIAKEEEIVRARDAVGAASVEEAFQHRVRLG